MTDLATQLEAIRDKFVMAQPDKPDSAFAVMTRAVEALRDFDWLTGLYDDRELTRDDVANELHDYRVMIDNVPTVYNEVTGGVLSKPMYPASVVISYFNDHVESLIAEEIKDRGLIDPNAEPTQ